MTRSEVFCKELLNKVRHECFPAVTTVPAFLNVFTFEKFQGLLSCGPGAQREGRRVAHPTRALAADRNSLDTGAAWCPQLLELENHPHVPEQKQRLVLLKLAPQRLVNTPLTPELPFS